MPDSPDLHLFTVQPCTPAQAATAISLASMINHARQDEHLFATYYQQLSQTAYNKQGRLKSWVLVKRSDTDGEGYAYAHTFRTDAWVKDIRGIREINVYWLCLVFTPLSHRGKGYSRRLCTSLHYIMAPHTTWPPSFGDAPLAAYTCHQLPASASGLTTGNIGMFEKCPIGPAGVDQSGWTPAGDSANGDVSFPLEIPPLAQNLNDRSGGTAPDQNRKVPAGTWEWAWVWQNQLDQLQPGLREAMFDDLVRTRLAPHTRIIRQRPDTPGILAHLDLRTAMVVGDRTPVPPSFPAGLHFYRAGERVCHLKTVPDIHPRWEQNDPLVLFVPGIVDPGELYLSLTANFHPDVIPHVLPALRAGLQAFARLWPQTLHTVRLWGHGADDPLVLALINEYNAVWKSRNQGGVTNCMVWYGEPLSKTPVSDEKATLVSGLEMWAMG